jgi:putative nucleotidyltransferase-like protein
VLGGQDQTVLKECIAAGQFPQLFDTAQHQDLLPALAARCNEQNAGKLALGENKADLLTQALMENTRHNMHISAQALKLTRRLNQAGITPLFLKGTARLLTRGADNLGFRKQVDIDLIVQPAELKAAGDAFLADGYKYYEYSSNPAVAPKALGDTASAIKLSATHHHLPPLAKTGYATTVELHRHFLSSRFQRANPLEPLFSSAHQHDSHGATFKVPSTEYQLIHLILGKLVNDGCLARRSFPVREACDYIELLNSKKGRVDQELVTRHCGTNHAVFSRLVTELMGYTPRESPGKAGNVTRRLQLMEKRYNSSTMAKILDAHARAIYLTQSMLYSPGKLPAYLRRLVKSEG